MHPLIWVSSEREQARCTLSKVPVPYAIRAPWRNFVLYQLHCVYIYKYKTCTSIFVLPIKSKGYFKLFFHIVCYEYAYTSMSMLN